MLRKRIIPMILLDGFSVLKTISFKDRRNLGSPITVIRTYNTRNVDELILLDIDATKNGRAIDRFTIQDIAKESFMPLTVGGGIKSIEDIQSLLAVGADKVTINRYAFENPSFISAAANIFGSQCIVVSVDIFQDGKNYYIYSNGESLKKHNLDAWILKIAELGAGEILINHVNRDGTMTGADIFLADYISNLVAIPVIYAGGVSSPEDAAKVASTNISAVAAASIFHFTGATPEDCRQALKNNHIPAR